MKRYNPKEIEPKWQKAWEEQGIYHATEDPAKPKRYVLEYFPYPSGAAMHVGHVRNYTIGDAIARFARMRGNNVLHPMGWDAFGLPAENYAIKTGISPQQAVAENVGRFKQQLMQMGFSYDWTREINSTDPEYYRWTQWFFELLFKKGLAYQQESLQWWCPFDKTVLANEQVEAGRCWRCGYEVEKKALKQWFFKITDYADRLLSDLDEVNWSDAIKSMQRNWIGRSQGAEIDFKIDGHKDTLKVFTTRPDTLYGATFMVLAPEHPLVKQITTEEHKQHIANYVKAAQAKSEVDRQETNREKTGVFTGTYAVNPVNDEKIPIWIADYVLMGYGTGAIMAVPAHDERDYAFAKKFDLPIKQVVAPETGTKRDNETFADGGSSVVFDPERQQYAFAKLPHGSVVLFAGGMKDSETVHEAILRELNEESGLTDIASAEEIAVAYGHYRNTFKKVNRRAKATALLVVLKSAAQQEQKLESYEKIEVMWADPKTVLEKWQNDSSGDYEHYIFFLKQAVARAIETGVDTTSDPAVFFAEPISGEGVMVNSGSYDDLSAAEARDKIVADLAKMGTAEERVQYKVRDWLISRQRYWGAPIPIIHCPEHGAVPVPEDQLPVVLPEVKSYEPSGDGRSPLANVPEFFNTTCPTCGKPATRETDTMDGFACSSWYFLRFADPHNYKAPFDKAKADFWLPVDDYIGGAEHAVMHLLYARMWTKVMFDEGLIDFKEPFMTLRNQGMILAPDGLKMSKSKGNTIEPDSIIEQGYGADSIRIMELFIGPWNQSANWSVEGMGGSFRFLQRVWALAMEHKEKPGSENNSRDLLVATHQAIAKVSADLEDLGFNTAIAALMEFTNELYRLKAGGTGGKDWDFAILSLIKLLAPFAPHITEELWQELGQKGSVHTSDWPVHDTQYLVKDSITIAVQVNGKLRTTIEVAAKATKDEILAAANADENVQKHLGNKKPAKEIYVPGRLVNLVV